jgi:hypothetical protein
LVVGLVVGLAGAVAAVVGIWLGASKQRQLDREKWEQAQEDARAAAVIELTRHLAAASQEMTWFTGEAELRKTQFGGESITNYDAAMKTHLAAVIEALVAVAHRDEEAYRALFGITQKVWALDGQVARAATDYWSEPEAAITKIANLKSAATHLELGLPDQIVDASTRPSAPDQGRRASPG